MTTEDNNTVPTGTSIAALKNREISEDHKVEAEVEVDPQKVSKPPVGDVCGLPIEEAIRVAAEVIETGVRYRANELAKISHLDRDFENRIACLKKDIKHLNDAFNESLSAFGITREEIGLPIIDRDKIVSEIRGQLTLFHRASVTNS